MNEERIRKLNTFSVPKRPDMDSVVKRLGQEDLAAQEWLVLTPRDKLPQPKKESYPRPAKRDDGSYIYDKIPSSAESTRSSQPHQMLYKKRAYEGDSSGTDTPLERGQIRRQTNVFRTFSLQVPARK